jgi:catechol 2,3-dioxygenase-like lactoylglutathione lyase family enzyme
MTIQRLENLAIVVEDLAAATAFFVELGLKLLGDGPVEGVCAEVAMLESGRAWRPRADEVRGPKGPQCDRNMLAEQIG